MFYNLNAHSRSVYCCLFLILLKLALCCANSGSAVVIIFWILDVVTGCGGYGVPISR